MTARPFHPGDLLSITDGRLVSPRHIEGVYDILGWMTGQDSLFTHQLPRAARSCASALLEQHPWLEGEDMKAMLDELGRMLDRTEDAKETVTFWLDLVVAMFGELHLVEPVPHAHLPRDPVEELREMMGPDKPIIIILDPEERDP